MEASPRSRHSGFSPLHHFHSPFPRISLFKSPERSPSRATSHSPPLSDSPALKQSKSVNIVSLSLSDLPEKSALRPLNTPNTPENRSSSETRGSFEFSAPVSSPLPRSPNGGWPAGLFEPAPFPPEIGGQTNSSRVKSSKPGLLSRYRSRSKSPLRTRSRRESQRKACSDSENESVMSTVDRRSRSEISSGVRASDVFKCLDNSSPDEHSKDGVLIPDFSEDVLKNINFLEFSDSDKEENVLRGVGHDDVYPIERDDDCNSDYSLDEKGGEGNEESKNQESDAKTTSDVSNEIQVRYVEHQNDVDVIDEIHSLGLASNYDDGNSPSHQQSEISNTIYEDDHPQMHHLDFEGGNESSEGERSIEGISTHVKQEDEVDYENYNLVVEASESEENDLHGHTNGVQWKSLLGQPVLGEDSQPLPDPTPDESRELEAGGLVYGIPALFQELPAPGNVLSAPKAILHHGSLVTLISKGKRLASVFMNDRWELRFPPPSIWNESEDYALGEGGCLSMLWRWPLECVFILNCEDNGKIGFRSIAAAGRTLSVANQFSKHHFFDNWSFSEKELWQALPCDEEGGIFRGWNEEAKGIEEGEVKLANCEFPERTLSVSIFGLVVKSLSAWRKLESDVAAVRILRHQVMKMNDQSGMSTSHFTREASHNSDENYEYDVDEAKLIISHLNHEVHFFENELQKAMDELIRLKTEKPPTGMLAWHRNLGQGATAVLELERRLTATENEAEELREKVKELEKVAAEAEMMKSKFENVLKQEAETREIIEAWQRKKAADAEIESFLYSRAKALTPESKLDSKFDRSSWPARNVEPRSESKSENFSPSTPDLPESALRWLDSKMEEERIKLRNEQSPEYKQSKNLSGERGHFKILKEKTKTSRNERTMLIQNDEESRAMYSDFSNRNEKRFTMNITNEGYETVRETDTEDSPLRKIISGEKFSHIKSFNKNSDSLQRLSVIAAAAEASKKNSSSEFCEPSSSNSFLESSPISTHTGSTPYQKRDASIHHELRLRARQTFGKIQSANDEDFDILRDDPSIPSLVPARRHSTLKPKGDVNANIESDEYREVSRDVDSLNRENTLNFKKSHDYVKKLNFMGIEDSMSKERATEDERKDERKRMDMDVKTRLSKKVRKVDEGDDDHFENSTTVERITPNVTSHGKITVGSSQTDQSFHKMRVNQVLESGNQVLRISPSPNASPPRRSPLKKSTVKENEKAGNEVFNEKRLNTKSHSPSSSKSLTRSISPISPTTPSRFPTFSTQNEKKFSASIKHIPENDYKRVSNEKETGPNSLKKRVSLLKEKVTALQGTKGHSEEIRRNEDWEGSKREKDVPASRHVMKREVITQENVQELQKDEEKIVEGEGVAGSKEVVRDAPETKNEGMGNLHDEVKDHGDEGSNEKTYSHETSFPQPDEEVIKSKKPETEVESETSLNASVKEKVKSIERSQSKLTIQPKVSKGIPSKPSMSKSSDLEKKISGEKHIKGVSESLKASEICEEMDSTKSKKLGSGKPEPASKSPIKSRVLNKVKPIETDTKLKGKTKSREKSSRSPSPLRKNTASWK